MLKSLRDLLASGADQATVQAKKEDLCKKSLTFLLCLQDFHHVNLTLLIVIRITTTKAKRASHHKEFYKKYVNLPLEDYVSVINAPTADKPTANLHS